MGGLIMPIKPPTVDDLARIARNLRLGLSASDLESFRQLLEGPVLAYARLDQLEEPAPVIKYPRDSGQRPAPGQNPLNAWYWRCEIHGAPGGPLKGKTFAIKDNVAVAGIPMMNGTALLEGFVANIDATVVTRILDAGGTILGKSVCESLCFSGGSHTSDNGPVRNPHDRSRSTGGSSSGSGALVASSAVDMAIGGDQGGSIRIPSSWCGIYGLKPTYGLVPYTGAFPIELTLDHLGPMARSAADCALMLEAIAGPDGLDPRQRADLIAQPYSKMLSGDVRGLRFALVREGFGISGYSEKDVDECVIAAARSFEKLGARVSEVSIPWHRDGGALWNAIGCEGALTTMHDGSGFGNNWKGYYPVAMLDGFARGLTERPAALSETTKMFLMLGQYMREQYHGRYYAKARNLARSLTSAYDAALKEADLLAMPTTSIKATLLPAAGCSREEYIERATNMGANTGQFDVTGHPAMNVPCGISAGLPVGMMLVGRLGDDAMVLRAADAWQRNFAS
jgi:amidase